MSDHFSIRAVLQYAAQQFKANPHARLEAEILLGHVLQLSRSQLLAYPETLLDDAQYAQCMQCVERRVLGEPIAYILGEKEFWSLTLKVNAATLIPRPETEALVEHVLQSLPQDAPLHIADLGTGSGAIALALATERPHWHIIATDQSAAALAVAKENRNRLGLKNVEFYLGKWCAALPQQKFHAIVSNPPYIAAQDSHLTQGDLRFEPQSSLVSGEDGLDDIRRIITETPAYLLPEGELCLEHGWDQGGEVRDIMRQQKYHAVQTFKDLSGLERVTVGRLGLKSGR